MIFAPVRPSCLSLSSAAAQSSVAAVAVAVAVVAAALWWSIQRKRSSEAGPSPARKRASGVSFHAELLRSMGGQGACA